MTRHLITSALPYINGVKHLGNLVGSMLPADIYARYLRLRGEEVLYICATDEHGTPAELAAKEAGLPVAEFCRQQHEVQAEIGDRFGLSWDHFGRSSSSRNHELTNHFAQRLEAEGYLEERTTKQVYSHADGRFLPDRYIVGTCPYCGYTNARGDQCENCTRVLDPTDLLEPRSAISGSTDLEVRETRHVFLLQSKLEGEVRDWVEAHAEVWPNLTLSIARKWLTEGLKERSITRDLDWGVPVADRPGFEDKVWYVWFDAPIEYLGATAEWADLDPEARDWRSWWYDADDVEYTQFMAKDNVPFHTVSFPVTLIGSREPWKRADQIKAFNWLTYYGGKFSTSQGRGVFMDQALDTFPADFWRWYLFANAPESSDSSFTWDTFAVAVNKDLADSFGNLVNRCLTLSAKHFGPEVPTGGAPGEREQQLAAELAEVLAGVSEHMAGKDLRKAANEIRRGWALANAYWEQSEPWKAVKADKDAAAVIFRTTINLLRVLAVVAWPVIPTSSQAVLDALGAGAPTWPDADAVDDELAHLAPGHPVTVPPVLFAKISEDQQEELAARF
ncbi:MAG: methionine--tRNA ligase, partial [Acidimicrobiales bacterium]